MGSEQLIRDHNDDSSNGDDDDDDDDVHNDCDDDVDDDDGDNVKRLFQTHCDNNVRSLKETNTPTQLVPLVRWL